MCNFTATLAASYPTICDGLSVSHHVEITFASITGAPFYKASITGPGFTDSVAPGIVTPSGFTYDFPSLVDGTYTIQVYECTLSGSILCTLPSFPVNIHNYDNDSIAIVVGNQVSGSCTSGGTVEIFVPSHPGTYYYELWANPGSLVQASGAVFVNTYTFSNIAAGNYTIRNYRPFPPGHPQFGQQSTCYSTFDIVVQRRCFLKATDCNDPLTFVVFNGFSAPVSIINNIIQAAFTGFTERCWIITETTDLPTVVLGAYYGPFDECDLCGSSCDISSTITSDDENCGQGDGSITVTPTNGTGPYSYLWSNGATTATITNLSAGSYSVTITDTNDCTGVNSVVINDIPCPKNYLVTPCDVSIQPFYVTNPVTSPDPDPDTYVGNIFNGTVSTSSDPPTILSGCFNLSPAQIQGVSGMLIDVTFYSYGTCELCDPSPCWILTRCNDSTISYSVSTDLSSLVGQVINNIVLIGCDPTAPCVTSPEQCWIVSQGVACTTNIQLQSYGEEIFPDCQCCDPCADIIIGGDASADIDLSNITLEDGMNGTISANIGGTVIILATFSGDFAAFTLSQFIDLLVSLIASGTSGFIGTNNDPILTITVPANLGINPVNSTVTLTFDPEYYLRSERTNPDIIGFTVGIGYPAYVNNPASAAFGFLYVTNSNRLSQTANVDYSAAGLGSIITFPCVPSIAAVVLAVGNIIELRSAIHTITGTVFGLGYNPGTGVLTFQVTAISAGIVGIETWNLLSIDPAFGSINVYQYNIGTGQLDLLPTVIYTPYSTCTSCFYDSDSDAVYVLCGGSQGVGTGVIRIDCSSPFIVAASVPTAPVISTGALMDNPLTENLYFFGNSFNFILKANKSLAPIPIGYNPASNITTAAAFTLPPIPPSPDIFYLSRNFAKTVDPTTGIVYYAQYYSDTYKDYVLKLDPTFVSLATPDVPSIFFKFDDMPNGELGAGVYDMFYHASTQRLFVARYLFTGKFFFQSYDLNGYVPGPLPPPRTDHPTPFIPVVSVDGLCNSIINYQPQHDKILIMNDTIVFVFDPNTLTYSSSSVSQPNFAENFSRTDDLTNKNFYGSSGARWLSVISYIPSQESIIGIFEGEATVINPCKGKCDYTLRVPFTVDCDIVTEFEAESGWDLSNPICHIPGSNIPLTTVNTITAGTLYTATVVVTVTTGKLILHIGGIVKQYIASGTFTFDFTATVNDEAYFTVLDDSDQVCVVSLTVCTTIYPILEAVTVGLTDYDTSISFDDITAIQDYITSLGFGDAIVTQYGTFINIKVLQTLSAFVSVSVCANPNNSPCTPQRLFFTQSNCISEPPPYQRVIPDPVKIFFQIKESTCDINVVQRFTAGMWNKVKELKFGITDCCEGFNLEQLWVNKQISDVTQLLIPDVTCTPAPSSDVCCPWLPVQACDLIPNPSGGTGIFGIAGENLFIGRVVMLGTNGKIYLNDPLNVATYQRAVGFATQDAVTNQQVRIIITGQLTNPSWALSTGSLYYASASGNITSIIPLVGISQIVGIAQSSSTMIVDIRQPIVI